MSAGLQTVLNWAVLALEGAHSPRMPPEMERFYWLEHEFRVLSKQIRASAHSTDRDNLRKLRDEIIVEARDIVRRINVPDPNWCASRWELG
jgi:hypothetical protein